MGSDASRLVELLFDHLLLVAARDVLNHRFPDVTTAHADQYFARVVLVTAVHVEGLDGVGAWVLVVLDDDGLTDVDDLEQLDCAVPNLDEAFLSTSDDVDVIRGQRVCHFQAIYRPCMGVLIEHEMAAGAVCGYFSL